jgi:hypothetical protein
VLLKTSCERRRIQGYSIGMGLEKGEGIGDALGRHFCSAVRVAVRGMESADEKSLSYIIFLLQLKRGGVAKTKFLDLSGRISFLS